MDLICVEPVEAPHFTIRVRQHQLSVDYSHSDGGKDRGPSPTEMLVGSLGTCIGMTVARYCQTVGCSTAGLEICLTFELPDTGAKRIKTIIVDVDLPEGFPPNRVSALARVVRDCPIHNTLTSPPQIDIEFSTG